MNFIELLCSKKVTAINTSNNKPRRSRGQLVKQRRSNVSLSTTTIECC